MLKYCPNCGVDRECVIESRLESYPVRGKEIEIEAKVLVCTVCGEDVFDLKLDSETLRKVYAKARKENSDDDYTI
jgi:ribosomal protein S27AE